MANRFRIVLLGLGRSPKQVISRIRDVTGFSLEKTDWFVSNLPLPLVDGLDDREKLDELKNSFEGVGAEISVEPAKTDLPMMVWHSSFDKLSHVCSQIPPRPYSFGWVIENQLAGMARPTGISDIKFLQTLGFDLVITLTESALSETIQSNVDARFVHLSVRDMARPTDEQIDVAVSEIDKTRKNHGKAVVHCGAGMGRTGVILACYLVSLGNTANDAINSIRYIRPGSIETRDQELCIVEFENRMHGKS